MAATPAAKPLLKAAVFDGYDFGLRLAYIPKTSAVMKMLQVPAFYLHEKAHPHRGMFRVPQPVLSRVYEPLVKALAQHAAENQVEVNASTDAFWDMCLQAMATPDRRAFVYGLSIDLYPLSGVAGVAMTAHRFHPGTTALARTLRGVFLSSIKSWSFGETSPAMLRDHLIRELLLTEEEAKNIRIAAGDFKLTDEGLQSNEVSLDVEQGCDLPPAATAPLSNDKEAANVSVLAAIAKLEVAIPVDLTALDMGAAFGLDPYQCDGVRHLLRSTSALLADDPGLGKTVQALVAGHLRASHDGGRILVIAPASLLYGWRDEILRVLPGENVSIRVDDGAARWIVTNYEQAEQLLASRDSFRVVLIDEAHYLKEADALRTRTVFELTAQIANRYLLTGTPLMSREVELHSLLRLSGHPLGALTGREFVSRYTGSSEFRHALSAAIGTWMLRRRKADVLTSLKGRLEQTYKVALTVEQRLAYDRILHHSQMTALEKVTRLRQLLEVAKTHSIVEQIASIPRGEKLLIFCEFRETVELLMTQLQELSPVKIVGDMSIAARNKAVERLRTDPNVGGLIGTSAAAGVGLNLQVAAILFLAGLPWTPAAVDQILSRADRRGQTRQVLCKIPLVEDSIDIEMWDLIGTKQQIFTDVIDGNPDPRAHIASSVAH